MSTARISTRLSVDPFQIATGPEPARRYGDASRGRGIWYDEEIDAWVCLAPDLVREMLANSVFAVRPPSEPVPVTLLGTAAGAIFGRLARMSEDPDHGQRRAMVERALAMVDLDQAREFAGEEMARAIAAGGEPEPIPLAVAPRVLGRLYWLDSEAVERLPELTDAFCRVIVPGATAAQLQAGIVAAGELRAIFERSLATAAEDGLIRAMVTSGAAAGIDGETQIANLIGFLFQGYEATAGLIGSAIRSLDGERADANRIREALDGVLAHEAPIQNTRRFATRAVGVGGAEITAGDAVVVVLGQGDGIEFGHGRHECPGQAIARAMAEGALAAWVRAPIRLEFTGFRPSGNARVPLFHRVTS